MSSDWPVQARSVCVSSVAATQTPSSSPLPPGSPRNGGYRSCSSWKTSAVEPARAGAPTSTTRCPCCRSTAGTLWRWPTRSPKRCTRRASAVGPRWLRRSRTTRIIPLPSTRWFRKSAADRRRLQRHAPLRGGTRARHLVAEAVASAKHRCGRSRSRPCQSRSPGRPLAEQTLAHSLGDGGRAIADTELLVEALHMSFDRRGATKSSPAIAGTLLPRAIRLSTSRSRALNTGAVGSARCRISAARPPASVGATTS